MELDQNQKRFLLLAVGGVVAFLGVIILFRPRTSTSAPDNSSSSTPPFVPTSNYDITINPTPAPAPSPSPTPTPRPVPAPRPAPHPVPPGRKPPVRPPTTYHPPTFRAPAQRAAATSSAFAHRVTTVARQIMTRPSAERAAPRVARVPLEERAAPRVTEERAAPRVGPSTPLYRNAIGGGMPALTGGNFEIAPFPWGYN